MRFTSFAHHVEDCNLGSINQLISGQPKFWYGVPSKYAKEVERLTSAHFKVCDLYIRHKTLLIPPSILQTNGIEFCKVNTFFLFIQHRQVLE